MPFQKIQPEKLSAAVVRQIEQLILRGILRPGERLPAERDLAERFGVSRPSLREAVAELEEQGLLSARAGSGIYVADVLGSAFSPALQRLFATHDEAVFDYLSFRKDIEALAVIRAVRFGSQSDLGVVHSIFERMETSLARRNAEEEARLDVQFHTAIIEASHNVVMLHMMRSMYDLLHAGVFYNRQVMFRQHTSRATLLDQHRAINTALQARDAEAAEQAVRAHLGYVEKCLRDDRRAEANEDIARLRLAHEHNRD